MNFRTEIKLQHAPFEISHRSKIFMAGSCFSENICRKFSEAKFHVCGNPFGVLFNPASIASMLRSLACRRSYTHEDLSVRPVCASENREGRGVTDMHGDCDSGSLWFSWDHHGSFSGTDREKVLCSIRSASVRGADALEQADTVIITFGTSWIYRLAAGNNCVDGERDCEIGRTHMSSQKVVDSSLTTIGGHMAGLKEVGVHTGQVVANCHKMPAEMFVRESMCVDKIVDLYTPLFEGILRDKKVIFTISPVRHLKDGFAENSLSKAILRIAVGELVEKYDNALYFPAFEIVNDDLRDYRFYADDMLHPSDRAVDYIWEKFCSWGLSNISLGLLHKLEKLSTAMKHVVKDHAGVGNALFASRMLSLIDELSAALPEVDFSRERNYFLCLTANTP